MLQIQADMKPEPDPPFPDPDPPSFQLFIKLNIFTRFSLTLVNSVLGSARMHAVKHMYKEDPDPYTLVTRIR